MKIKLEIRIETPSDYWGETEFTSEEDFEALVCSFVRSKLSNYGKSRLKVVEADVVSIQK